MDLAELEALEVGACLHCGQQLEQEPDGDEVCRYCFKAFGSCRGVNGVFPPRCPACAQERFHTPEDLAVVASRLAGVNRVEDSEVADSGGVLRAWTTSEDGPGGVTRPPDARGGAELRPRWLTRGCIGGGPTRAKERLRDSRGRFTRKAD